MQELTLGEDIHRVIDLDVHVITNGRELLAFSGDDPSILALDLIRGRAFLGETPGDHDTLAIILGAIRLFSLILQDDRYF